MSAASHVMINHEICYFFSMTMQLRVDTSQQTLTDATSCRKSYSSYIKMNKCVGKFRNKCNKQEISQLM